MQLAKSDTLQGHSPAVQCYLYTSGASVTDSSHPKPIKNEAEARAKFKPKSQLAGSATLVGDLEEASTEITDSVLDSLARSA